MKERRQRWKIMMCIQYLNERMISVYRHAAISKVYCGNDDISSSRERKVTRQSLSFLPWNTPGSPRQPRLPPFLYYFVKSSICGINVPRRIPTSCQVSRGNFPKTKGRWIGRQGRKIVRRGSRAAPTRTERKRREAG